uniref:Uncharacterized protein n=1 Tax=Angiostrongylus cantonensis TaxID=6313 RepID=A0A0K0DA68_ANGCA
MDGYPLIDVRRPPDIAEPDAIHESLRIFRLIAVRVLGTILRLPGLILLELWWRNRDINIEEVAQEMLTKVVLYFFLFINH